MDSKLSDKLKSITETTLGHYNGRSIDFWNGTRDHDVSQNIEALLSAISGKPPFSVLDFGCGPGRDILNFKELGHNPVGLDGCENFSKMAREYSGCDVLHQNFLELNLPKENFDGIFANASLFHIPRSEFKRVLQDLVDSLKMGGVLFSSNPRGTAEGWNGQRWAYYMELEEYQAHLESVGLALESHYYRPSGLPREQQPWLACIARKK
ncbi:class I SAM-dependent methyltransferase [Halobacteriovorax sp. JY17]|uniref:class I SAM-dependent DNA methyltransferase n=1 Tax=Halobacteriovorax sp. JY17 TaxID=2014617 RepID=UPI000C395679|nr:class I SAM-dependent methyltransferase [Halobacteriovorax sp. JY17]PIK16337.1 MAG: SAM-dependent methyltransferase [Halobacteriovorax sp. JY17]